MTQIWAHRGASELAPENTMPAFATAIELHADGIELDVQLSRDGQVVVIHDETLERTTTGAGRVVDHTLAELEQLDASYGRTDFAGARIPRLIDVLELLVPSGLLLNIELKNSVIDYPGLEEKVLELVTATGMTDRVVFSSFSTASLARLADLTDIELGFLFEPKELLSAPWRKATELGVGALQPHRLQCTDRLITKAHERGLKVRPWVVNKPKHARKLIEAGVDGLITDGPGRLRDKLAAR